MSQDEAIKRALEMIKAGRKDEAREVLKEALKQDRENAKAWALMFQISSGPQEGAFCLQQVLRLRPGDSWATEMLAKLKSEAPAAAPAPEPPPPAPPKPSAPPARSEQPSQPLFGERPEPPAEPKPFKPAPRPQAGSQPASSLDSLFSDSTPPAPEPPAPEAASPGDWIDSGAAPAAAQPSTLRAADDSGPESPAGQGAGGSSILLYIGFALVIVSLVCIIAGVLAFRSGILNTSTGGLPGVGSLTGSSGDWSGDGHDTVFTGAIALNETQRSQIDEPFDAHNWQFEGTAGQTITLWVVGESGCDPEVIVYGPNGREIASDDDSGGGSDVQLQLTLPSDGTYTFRVRVWITGPYAITIN